MRELSPKFFYFFCGLGKKNFDLGKMKVLRKGSLPSPASSKEKVMDAQYDWQVKERMATSLHDLPDEEFDKRLEVLLLQLEEHPKEAA
jgi:hypothetical protein